MKTPQPVALLLGMPSRRRPAACIDGLAARAPAPPLASTVLWPAKMIHRRKPVGRLPLTITRSLSPSRTPAAITKPRRLAYTKPTRTARHQHARAASPPSARRSTAHPRANVLVSATILRVPPPTFAPHTLPASHTPAPLLSPLHMRHTCLSGIYECLSSDSSCSTTIRFEVRAGRGGCAFPLPEGRIVFIIVPFLFIRFRASICVCTCIFCAD
jgi:hypothetical protein